MKPVDEQLNRAAAESCGWRHVAYEFPAGWFACELRSPDYILGQSQRWATNEPETSFAYQPPFPDYCNDRNALPELWAAVEQAGKQDAVYWHLPKWTRKSGFGSDNSHHWILMTRITPVEQIIACLKALDKWPAEWED